MLDGTYTIDDVQLMHDVLDEIAAVVERGLGGSQFFFLAHLCADSYAVDCVKANRSLNVTKKQHKIKHKIDSHLNEL
ncbi:hypothetical protein [Yersinia enterocolitica]